MYLQLFNTFLLDTGKVLYMRGLSCHYRHRECSSSGENTAEGENVELSAIEVVAS
jgi:hypothetical protein